MNRLSTPWTVTPVALHIGRIEAAQVLRCGLFIGVFLLIWISLEPFHNLGDATTIDVASGRGPTYARSRFSPCSRWPWWCAATPRRSARS